jgi:predicted  nucleic acid-binding Zn-ribbon protein
MVAIILLLLLIAPAWSLAQEAEEISLAEAARRERERRAGFTEKVQVITNKEIEEMEGLVSQATAPEAATEAVEGGEAEERSWETRFDDARTDLQGAENRGQVLQLQMEYLRNQWLSSDNGVTQQRIRQQLDKAQKGLEVSRQEIEAARAAYQALQKEAEGAGLLPGELRLLMGKDS